ncbi:methyltransferase domain-containing protein [Diplocarpon rosae]|nr:methyltransferase domain-containing protein [Diplocarpon rosae]
MASPAASAHDSAISVATMIPLETSYESLSAESSYSDPRMETLPPAAESSTQLSAQELEEAAAHDAETENAVSQAQDEIEIDTWDSDSASDAGYETDSMGSASSSISSSIRDFAFENGRRYHKFREGSYNFPNDPSEQDREDMKHAMMVNLLGGRLHFAPIGENPQNILDMGTGTGIWAIEMGDLYPGANILGVDLSPIQPEWVPANVKFMVDDVESPWLKPPNYFEYIHARHTVMAIRNWPLLMKRALE